MSNRKHNEPRRHEDTKKCRDGKPQISWRGIAATEYSTPKVLMEAVGRLIHLRVWLRKEKMQTQGLPPPNPRLDDEDRCAGTSAIVGGETGSHSRRAAGFAPNVPHFLGKARPLLRVLDRGVFDSYRGVPRERRSFSCRMRDRQKNGKFEDSGADLADKKRSRNCNSNLRNLRNLTSASSVEPRFIFLASSCLRGWQS